MNVSISLLQHGDLFNGFLSIIDSEATIDAAHQINILRRENGVDTYVAKIVDEVVGTFSVFIIKKFIHKGGKVAHIEDVAVIEYMRHKGIGRAMMNYADSIARTAGCYKIVLDCDYENIGFYEKCGYRLCDKTVKKDLVS